MNILDIIAIAIFLVFVVVCAWRGLLKIIARWAAFFAAMILSKVFGGLLGNMLLGDLLGGFASVIGTVVLFVLLYIVCRILFGMLAKTINKVLHTKTLDHVLGGAVGTVGGLSAVFLYALAAELVVAVVSIFNADAGIVNLINTAAILKFFMM